MTTQFLGPSWNSHQLVTGTGAHGKLPVMEEVKREAQHRKIDLIIRSIPQAFQVLQASP